MSDIAKTYKRASDKRNTAIKVEKGKRGKGKKDEFLSPDLNMFSPGLGPHDRCIRGTWSHRIMKLCVCVYMHVPVLGGAG